MAPFVKMPPKISPVKVNPAQIQTSLTTAFASFFVPATGVKCPPTFSGDVKSMLLRQAMQCPVSTALTVSGLSLVKSHHAVMKTDYDMANQHGYVSYL